MGFWLLKSSLMIFLGKISLIPCWENNGFDIKYDIIIMRNKFIYFSIIISKLQKLYICSMEKYILICVSLLLFSCENKLDINADWKDIPVVYAVFDAGTQEDSDGSNFEPPNPFTEFNYDGDSDPDFNYTHFVRVQRSFLGSESAYNYVDISDSIYYSQDHISVWVELVDPTYSGSVPPAQIPLSIADNSQLQIAKEDGLFNSDNHI